ncbi:aromatic ring-hydroxylating dioxygenase subunit alpha [Microbaculum marinum]|uniref:Aromatic ring-hydroxylating dioxygenase subunit alpha n=1 Tax=Microbaculum marinum TaxID=1764581 RepID=A0AAW9RIX9_9HYPH
MIMRNALARNDLFDDEFRGGLPAWTYTSDEITELEMEHMFRRSWLVAGHVSEIPDPGDFITHDIVDERALIVRGQDGAVRAFHNLCRHRGSRVVAEPTGNCGNRIVCPFHGWCYNADGSLRGRAAEKTFPAAEKSELGLKPVDMEIWHGLIFIRFKGDGPSVAETMAPVEAEIAPYRIEDMKPLFPRYKVEVDVNWKAMVDVDAEGYHVPIAHPSLMDLYGRTYRDEILENGIARSYGTFADSREGKIWSVRNYKRLLPDVEHLPESHRRAWVYFSIFTGTALQLFPDMVDFYQFYPLTTNRSVSWGASFALPDDRREMKAARYLNQRINEITTQEDTQLIKWSCEGMRSSGYDDFLLSDLELGVKHFHETLRDNIPVMSLPEPPPSGTVAQVNAAMCGNPAYLGNR